MFILSYCLPSSAQPVLDWSLSAPEKSKSQGSDTGDQRDTPPVKAKVEAFPFSDQTTTFSSGGGSSGGSHSGVNNIRDKSAPTHKHKVFPPQQAPSFRPTIEPFSENWNSVGPGKLLSGESAISATQARRINNIQYEPIWRPLFSQITLDDFSAIDCCTRVMQSALWEAEGKCTKIGHKIWQVGIIPFVPEKEPINNIKSCYFLSKEGIGNAWHHVCTAKAQAKCYDPKLPQNYNFISQMHAEQVVHDDLEQEKAGGPPVSPLRTTLDQLLKRVPDMPTPPPPESIELPTISLE